MSTPANPLPFPPAISPANHENEWLIFNSYMRALYDKINELEARIQELEN